MSETIADRWARVRARYELGGVTVATLAKEEGVGASTVYARARAEGWNARRRMASVREQRVVWRRRVAGRLSTLAEELGAALAASSAHIIMGEGADDRDDPELSHDRRESAGQVERFEAVERRVRTLQSLLRAVREIERLGEPDAGPGAGKAAGAARDGAEDTDDPYAGLRRELERRLDRLVESG